MKLQKNFQLKNKKSLRLIHNVFHAAVLFIPLFFFSCKDNTNRKLVIWTNDFSFASYVEAFNAADKNNRAVVIYKENPAASLPPNKDEFQPDIVVSSYLKNSSVRRYFSPVDFLFEDKSLQKNTFYSELLNYGVINGHNYLLPVSFNIPAIIFHTQNSNYVKTEYVIDLKQMQEFSSQFNARNSAGTFTAMGYGPSWENDFLYEVTKLKGASYAERGTSFTWNQEAVESALNELKNWTTAENDSTMTEQNFQFRYLYLPKYRQVAGGRCLFAYTTSSSFFMLTESQREGLDFRWLGNDGTIPIEDDIVCMGIYSDSTNIDACRKFISWFFTSSTQQLLMERSAAMRLDTVPFGIAGGFSSIKATNANVFPVFYRNLLGNIPSEKSIAVPHILPVRWESLKRRVILPYLTESVSTDTTQPHLSLQERISNWTKQFY